MNKLPELRQFKRIAVIQTAFLGDIALALYLAERIKELHPDCELTFITTPHAAALVSCAKAVDNVITYDKRGMHSGWQGIKFISGILKQKNIDCIIGLQRSMRTSLVSYFAKPIYSVGFDKSTFSFLYKKRIKYIQGIHEVERNEELLNAFVSHWSQVLSCNWKLAINMDDDDKNYIDNLLSNFNILNKDNLVAIAPGSVWETKRWLPEYFEILIDELIKLEYKPVLIGSKDDLRLAERIMNNTGCLSIVGETSIPQLLYFFTQCKLTITNDSSPTHLAGLVGCRTLTIFGATVPEFGFSPLGKKDRSIGLDGLKCRPCSIHGGKNCPIKTFDCMVKLSPEIVNKEALKILESND
ncbi:MAG: glycosyltransferase family 9 protein [bacterium]